MKRFLTVFLLLSLAPTIVFGQESEKPEIPPDFKSDGCSLFPDGNYRDCCVAHDRDYYQGGTCKERLESDNRLYRCVRDKKGWYNKIVAPVMWVGVRIGGVSFLPTPFRWGFGRKKKKKKNEMKTESTVEKTEDSEKKSPEPGKTEKEVTASPVPSPTPKDSQSNNE